MQFPAPAYIEEETWWVGGERRRRGAIMIR
jgi:hypothetical protein